MTREEKIKAAGIEQLIASLGENWRVYFSEGKWIAEKPHEVVHESKPNVTLSDFLLGVLEQHKEEF